MQAYVYNDYCCKVSVLLIAHTPNTAYLSFLPATGKLVNETVSLFKPGDYANIVHYIVTTGKIPLLCCRQNSGKREIEKGNVSAEHEEEVDRLKTIALIKWKLVVKNYTMSFSSWFSVSVSSFKTVVIFGTHDL